MACKTCGSDSNTNLLVQIASTTAATQKDMEALRTELFSNGGRITKLETRMDKADDRHWITAAIITPLTLGFHGLLRHFGVQI